MDDEKLAILITLLGEQKVLPKIFVSFTPDGQTEPDAEFKAEDMTGEDQFALFSAMMSLIEVSEDYFQVIKS